MERRAIDPAKHSGGCIAASCPRFPVATDAPEPAPQTRYIADFIGSGGRIRTCDQLINRKKTPPDDGGLWSGPKVARWMGGAARARARAARLGSAKADRLVQAPRPRLLRSDARR